MSLAMASVWVYVVVFMSFCCLLFVVGWVAVDRLEVIKMK